MNYNIACENLGIDKKQKITKEYLKKIYRMNALKYHPDKNSSPDASIKFQEIHSSYEYLLKTFEYNSFGYSDDTEGTEENEEVEPTGYSGILFSFLKNIMKTDGNTYGLYYIIMNKISNTCEKKALEIIQKIDKNKLIKIYEIIKKYSEFLHFSNDFIDKIQEVLNDKIKNDEYIILNPTIDDLFANNLYKLKVNNFTYIVPLWHDELVYDNSGNDIYVKCYSMLPDNVSIDEKNNVHVECKYDIKEILPLEFIEINVGKQTFDIFTKELFVKQTQTIVLKNEGISKINTNDIYDISKKSDVYLHIVLE
jgi:DnaJ-class molecular chaperone